MPETIVQQILEGHGLPEGVRCVHCLCELREGARCGVVARRIDLPIWELNSIYCMEHCPDAVPETPFGTSVLATADVGALVDTAAQSHRPCLLSVEIVDCVLGDGECDPIIEAGEGSTVVR